MHLPFTADQFFDVFRRYNEAVWPAQIALNAVALMAAFAAYRTNARRSRMWARVAIVLLAGLWLWTGTVYFKMFFVTITPAGQIFGSFFIAEAAVLLLCAWEMGPRLEPVSRASLAVSGFILVYALLLYPIAGIAAGQRYPALPTFGAPCPLTIFTFGFLTIFPSSISASRSRCPCSGSRSAHTRPSDSACTRTSVCWPPRSPRSSSCTRRRAGFPSLTPRSDDHARAARRNIIQLNATPVMPMANSRR